MRAALSPLERRVCTRLRSKKLEIIEADVDEEAEARGHRAEERLGHGELLGVEALGAEVVGELP